MQDLAQSWERGQYTHMRAHAHTHTHSEKERVTPAKEDTLSRLVCALSSSLSHTPLSPLTTFVNMSVFRPEDDENLSGTEPKIGRKGPVSEVCVCVCALTRV